MTPHNTNARPAYEHDTTDRVFLLVAILGLAVATILSLGSESSAAGDVLSTSSAIRQVTTTY